MQFPDDFFFFTYTARVLPYYLVFAFLYFVLELILLLFQTKKKRYKHVSTAHEGAEGPR